MIRIVLVTLLFSVVALPVARAWDALGHMIVSQIAYDNLTPSAKSAFDQRLADFNSRNKTEYLPMVTGTYMDDIRDKTREYNAWHYINLPENREGLPLPPASEENVLSAINQCQAVLGGDSTDSSLDRDEAMIFLIHLVGDVHQPLHTTSLNDDRGGNSVKVPNLVDPALAIFHSSGNLHWFWDMGYRATTNANGEVVAAFAAPLYSRSAPVEGHLKAAELVREKASEFEKKYPISILGESTTPEEWVAESHEIGFDTGYGKLPGGPNANPVELDEAYVTAAREICEKRITLAGYHLAELLNQSLK